MFWFFPSFSLRPPYPHYQSLQVWGSRKWEDANCTMLLRARGESKPMDFETVAVILLNAS